MNNKEFEQIEKQLSKTHLIIKRDNRAKALTQQIETLAKQLPPESLLELIVRAVVGLSLPVVKKNIKNLIRESKDESIEQEIFQLMLNYIADIDIDDINNQTIRKRKIKLKDLLTDL